MKSPADILERLSTLKAERAGFETIWNEVDEYIGGPSSFGAVERAQGQKRGEKQFDSKPAIAADRLSAILASLMMPQNEEWHKLEVDDDSREDDTDQDAKAYLETVNRRLFRMRYNHRAGFAESMMQALKSTVRYGIGVVSIVDDGGVRYRHYPIQEVYIDTDFTGAIDSVYRTYQLNARQAVQAFGIEKLPKKIQDAAADVRKASEKFRFVQWTGPNTDRDPNRLDARGMAFSSMDVAEDDKTEVARGGYRSFPFAIARMTPDCGEIYGRSPAMQVLPSLKLLNQMKKTTLQTAQGMVRPTLLTADDASLNPFNLQPGAVVRGGVKDGKAQIMPLEINGNIPISLEMQDRERAGIADAFYISLFEILAEDRRQMTAQEVLQRAQEKGDLLGPLQSGMEGSFLGPLIDRDMDIAFRAGIMPEPPEAIRRIGGRYKIRYSSPITRAQRADKGVAVLRTAEAATALAQFDPSIVHRIDANAALETVVDSFGAPANMLRAKGEAQAMADQDAQNQQMSALLQAAPVAAQSAKTLMEAQQMSAMPGM